MSKNETFIKRLLRLPKDHSLFLFGPRGCGKSTLITETFNTKNSTYIDLLNSELEEKFSKNPNELASIITSLPKKTKYIVIDEVQKIPKLLDTVHSLIEKKDKIFILTGSSARKLKYGQANLLAGRAFVYNLHPFTYLELGEEFNLNDVLHWGLLPKIFTLKNESYKKQFLFTYTNTYLKEEVWSEQLIKNLTPFRAFLEISAQMNGKILNYSNIANDVGVDDKTVKQYFSILEDTLIGFLLPAYKNSFRKRLNTKPKFYFFDLGVKRALSKTLTMDLIPSTSAYGEAFEHFIILECIKLASYFKPEYSFSYLRTKDDAEIDLVVDRPGRPTLFIEIKSSKQVTKGSINTLYALGKDFKNCEPVCFSNDSHEKTINGIKIFPWKIGVEKYFKK